MSYAVTVIEDIIAEALFQTIDFPDHFLIELRQLILPGRLRAPEAMS